MALRLAPRLPVHSGIYSATYLAADVSVQYGTVGQQFREFEVTMRIGIRAVPVWYRPQAFGYLTVTP